MNGLIFALVAIGFAVFISGSLYDRRGNQSKTIGAVTGLTSNIILSTSAIAMILTAAIGQNYSIAIVGVVFLILMLFLARGNLEILRESEVRAKLAGQK
ncbi:hypothetical protein [Natrinema thermotolerans]|uniref:hypothetical protein n=1 Tax=Natrinema thermotolerans TaxID=121872 RepID=UPI0006792B16|nr:hypothetical protein [Natrinema thermotolerans]QCC57199.1 hypothetical protein DVR14_00560 [Natrinema thermotolerans]